MINLFIENEMDGDAIAMGLASSSGLEWLKDLVSKTGLRLKV